MIDKHSFDDITDPKFRPLCAEAIDLMNRWPIPGAVIGVLHGDQEFTAGFGVTSAEHPLPVDADTLFQVGSITKTFTATAIMRLVEIGQLDLDTPLRMYLPELRLKDEEVAARVTLRHLLTHTGGWVGDYFNDFGYGDEALAKMVDQIAKLPQLTPLGEVWSYNNAGFNLAGRVIEVVAGQSYEAALQQLVLDPLGLKRSFFFPQDVMTHRFVVGHEVVEHRPRVARPWPIGRAGHSVGGLVMSVKELLRYARFECGDGAGLLTHESLQLMRTPVLPASGIRSIGLSWFTIHLNGETIIEHGGGTKGQISLLRIVPEKNFAVVVLTNSDDGDQLTYPIADSALNSYLDLVMPKPAPLTLPAEKLAQYVGRYDAAGSAHDITLKSGELITQVTYKGHFPTPDSPPPPAPPPVRLALYAEDTVVALDDPMKDSLGEFLRDSEGCIVWFRFGSRLHACEKTSV